MGFRQAAVLSSACFFLGVLFICFNVDYRVLFLPVTDETVADAFQFYTMFYNAPPAIKALMHGVMGFGVLGLVFKLQKWDESALFFDGCSLAANIFSIGVYTGVTIPALRTIVTPLEGIDTREDQIEAAKVLSAGNTIIMVLLGSVLVMQGGQEYAKRLEARELEKFAEAEKGQKKAEGAKASNAKKDQ